MTGDGIALRRISDADVPVILEWFRSAVGDLANGVESQICIDDLRPVPAEGRDLLVAEMTGEGVVGVFNWTSQGCGSFVFGIALAPARVGSGYGAMILEQGVGHLFDQLRAHRVELRTATFNHHVLAMLRAGYMTVEAVLRETIYVDGRYESTVIASMLEREYREHVARGRMFPAKRRFSTEDLDRGAQALQSALASPRVPRSWDELRDVTAGAG